MATALTMHVPDELRGYQGDLAAALATSSLRTWDDEVTFERAAQVEAIAKVILPPIHGHLLNAHIAYVFRKSIKSQGRRVWGKAGKGGAKIEFFAGYDFVLEFSWEDWLTLSDMQKVALLDHELEHCGIDEDGDYIIVPHLIEEFGSIVQRWGLWRPDLMVFAGAMAHAQQLGLGLDRGRD